MNNTIVKKCFVLLFIGLFMALSSDVIHAFDKRGTLTITRKSDTKMEVEIYQVADYENGEYVLKSAFHDKTLASYHDQLVNENALHATDIEAYAKKMLTIAHKQKISPMYHGKLGKEISFQDVSKGLYVLAQVDHEDDQKQILPVVIGIPYWQEITLEDGNSQNQLLYDVVIQLKESDKLPPKPSEKPQGEVGTGDDMIPFKHLYTTMLIGSMIGIFWIRKHLLSEFEYEE